MSQQAEFDTDIAIVGMAGRFAGARDLREYWRNLRDGVESIQTLSDEELLASGVTHEELSDPAYVRVSAPLPGMEQFDAPFFGLTPREASVMDPQHRHFIECCWLALEDAAQVPERFAGAIGVYAGSGHNAYFPYHILSNPQLVQSVGFFLLRHTGNDKDFLTTRVSYLLNLKGPSVNIQTACSTSLVAIHAATQALLNGECDMALAGGVTIELPHRRGYRYEEGEILSPDGHCRPFDASSKGTVFGSGVGVVVLRRLSDALADGDPIRAVIKGSAINNDGAGKVSYLAPSVDGQAQSIAEALSIANVPADTITYVEAHGTGTPVGDPIEVAALTQAFRQSTDKSGFCRIGSVKSNIGHTDTAAGVASLMKVVLAMEHRELPPTLHFRAPNPACSFDSTPFRVNDSLTPWQPPPGVPRRAGVSSLGVGGTNAHVILQEAPLRGAPAAQTRGHWVLELSARTPSALDAAAQSLAAYLESEPGLSLAEVAHTLRNGRRQMPVRRVLVARDATDAAQLLRGADHLRVAQVESAQGPRPVVFMFAGGGAQHPGMGLDLYRDEPVFRGAVDECLEVLRQREGIDLAPLLFAGPGERAEAAKRLEQPSLALPALFTVQRAQALLWQSWGVNPSSLIGHSMGEYTAAHLAGVFSLADALALVTLRGRLFETLPEGGMLSVPLPAEEIQPLLGEGLSIAAVNADTLCVASGPVHLIEALAERLSQREVDSTRVRIRVAAHSSMLEPILERFHDFLLGVRMQPPRLRFVSNLSGTWITAEEATDPAYWVRHLRETVRFADGLRELLSDEKCLLLEVGPGRTLAALARMHSARGPAQAVLNGMRHPDETVSDQAFMLLSLARLSALGIEVDWSRVEGQPPRRRLNLPGYTFDHQKHWIEPGAVGLSRAAPNEGDGLRRQDPDQWFYRPAWKEQPLLGSPAAEPGESVLVLVDESGLAERIGQRLRELGASVATVRDGDGFSEAETGCFTVDGLRQDDFARVLSALAERGRSPTRVIHAWTVLGGRRFASQVEALRSLERRGLLSLLALVQAIGSEDLQGPVQLSVLTERACRIGADRDVEPAAAMVAGASRVIPQELPQVGSRSIDVQWPAVPARTAADLVDALVAETARGEGPDAVAYRGGSRWVLGFEQAFMPARSRPGYKPRGVYLVTGGLGGVGFALASHLGRTVQARLVLVARSALPARSRWEQTLGDPSTSPELAGRIRAVQQLEAEGAQVLPLAADVSDPASMRRVLQQTQSAFGELDGIFHAAGVLDDGPIALKDESALRAVLAPKVDGTLALEAALKTAPAQMQPDLWVLFSSVSAFAGLAGQFDYAAANAFLDAFAQQRGAGEGPYVLAVDWSQWRDVGMAAALARRLGLASASQLDGAPYSNVDHPLVQRRLILGGEDTVFEARYALDTHWLLAEHRLRGGEALIPGTGYLELIRASVSALDAGAVVELRDLTFLAPFVVGAGLSRALRVHLNPSSPGVFDVSVRGSAAATQGSEWVEHVSGTAALLEAPTPPRLPVELVAKRCSVRTQAFTGLEQPVHLEFGPRWGNLRRVDYGSGEALLTLELPAAFNSDLVTYELHPALMDWATAGAQALVPGFDEGKDFYVPASYGCVRILAPLSGQVFSHVRLRAEDTQPGEMAVFDVTVVDPAGRVLVDIERFTMLRLRDKALFDSAPEGRPTVLPSVANTQLAAGAREGISTQEGLEALDRILLQATAAQVVVSPQDLPALLRALRKPAVGNTSRSGDPGALAAADAPRTETEGIIATLWSELLGVGAVGREDNFFDLGGHSLLAVQVVNKLKKRTGRHLALTALVEAPTVRTLAELIDPEGSAGAPSVETPEVGKQAPEATAGPAEHKPAPIAVVKDPLQVNRTLITIRKGRESAQRVPPLFFVHDGLGEVLLYRTLALQLDPAMAIYGLQPAHRADGSYLHTRISDMAAAHLRQVRSVQPSGPYFITGLCAGGVIAMEMAAQLQRQGEQVAFVGIMDAADVRAAERPWRAAQERWERIASGFRPSQGQGAVAAFLAGCVRLAQRAVGYARYQISNRARRLREAREVARLRSARNGSTDQSGQGLSAPMAFLPLYEHAHREHVPEGRLGGADVALYRATRGDGTPADIAYVDIYLDHALGWRPRVDGPIDVVDVPGGHTSLLQEPHVKVLSAAMREHIDRARRRVAVGAAQTRVAQEAPSETAT